jgi:hypothetical protein
MHVFVFGGDLLFSCTDAAKMVCMRAFACMSGWLLVYAQVLGMSMLDVTPLTTSRVGGVEGEVTLSSETVQWILPSETFRRFVMATSQGAPHTSGMLKPGHRNSLVLQRTAKWWQACPPTAGSCPTSCCCSRHHHCHHHPKHQPLSGYAPRAPHCPLFFLLSGVYVHAHACMLPPEGTRTRHTHTPHAQAAPTRSRGSLWSPSSDAVCWAGFPASRTPQVWSRCHVALQVLCMSVRVHA